MNYREFWVLLAEYVESTAHLAVVKFANAHRMEGYSDVVLYEAQTRRINAHAALDALNPAPADPAPVDPPEFNADDFANSGAPAPDSDEVQP
jgi:hypothetical protein